MHPFFPSFPNQIQAQTGNNPALQQAMRFNSPQFPPSLFPHQNPASFNHPAPQAPPLPHGQNPRFRAPPMPGFSNQNTHFNNFHGNNAGAPNRPPCFVPPVNHMGIPPLLGQFGPHQTPQNLNPAMPALMQQNTPQFHGQHNHLSQLQNNHLAALLQLGGLLGAHNMPPNLNQTAGLQMAQLSSQGQMLGGNHVLPFQCLQQQQHPVCPVQSFNIPPSTQPGSVGNSQMVLANLNPKFGNGTVSTGHSAVQENPIATQNSQPLVSPSLMQAHQAWMNLQPNGQWQPQVNRVADGGNYISNVISDNATSKSFTRNLHGYGKGVSSNMRFQNYQFPHMKNAKGNMGHFAKNGEHKRRERNQLTKSTKQALTEWRRPLPCTYTEKEIRQWIEARQKNYPTTANIEKKLARRRMLAGRGRNQEDDEKVILRQQLKEVLAKQAELGVEVAEIPPRYLAEPKPNRHKKRWGGYDWQKRRSKKPKLGYETSTAPADTVKRREPTLLQKLLSADIRRDKSRLLQVFRFMVLNSLFEQWPDKPLEFPHVMLEDTGYKSEVAGEKNPSLDEVVVGKIAMDEEARKADRDGDDEEVSNHPIGEEEHVREQSEKPEEGEITE